VIGMILKFIPIFTKIWKNNIENVPIAMSDLNLSSAVFAL
jgi:hypothetical protein